MLAVLARVLDRADANVSAIAALTLARVAFQGAGHRCLLGYAETRLNGYIMQIIDFNLSNL